MDADADLEAVKEAVKEAVQAHRQQLHVARAELEEALGKSFSTKTLERYIKNMVQTIRESESVPFTKQTRDFTASKSRS